MLHRHISLSLTVLMAVVSFSAAHEHGLGKCQIMPSPLDFDSDKFLGTWYVIQQTDTDSQCLQLKFERKDSAQLQVTKVRKLPLLGNIGIDHTNRYSGVLDQPSDMEGRMKIKWTLNPAKSDYTVIDTDYDNYALIYDCQNYMLWFHRFSATILSRTNTLDPTKVEELRQKMTANGISLDEMEDIKHGNCQSLENTDLNIDVDRDTIGNGFRNFGTTLSGAAATIASVVTDSSSTRPTSPTTTTSSTTTTASPSTTTTASPATTTPNPRNAVPNDPSSNQTARPGTEPLDNNPPQFTGNPDDQPTQPTINRDTIDNTLNNVDESINNIDGSGTNRDDRTLGGEIQPPEPVNDIIRTVVSGI